MSNSSSYLVKKISLFENSNVLSSISEVVEGRFELSLEEKSSKKPVVELDHHEISSSLNLTDKITCLSCLLDFPSREEQIQHFKCDLHLFNLKQKLKGKAIVSAEEFEKLSDISSISGSDTEQEDNASQSDSSSDEEIDSKQRKQFNSPKMLFKLSDQTILSLYRCLIHSKKNIPETQTELLNLVKCLNPIEDRSCIILISAGHFAAGIFKSDKCLFHKTFHRYVVRAKRGGVQSQHDQQKHAKSAGANIRRRQETLFNDDIKNLIGVEWKSEIDKCSRIFIRIPKYNKGLLVSSNSVQTIFDKNDTRLRSIPFMSFRPTFNEVKRVYNLLNKIEIYNMDYLDLVLKYEKKLDSPQQKEKPQSKKIKSPKMNKLEQEAQQEEKGEEEEIESIDLNIKLVNEEPKKEVNKHLNEEFIQSLTGDDLKLFNDIYTCCVTNNLIKLKQIFSSQQQQQESFLIEKLLNKRLNRQNGFTLLHLASQLGFAEIVWELLINGSNPATEDLTKQKILPYFVSSNKSVRDQYRRFMNDYPNRYDYIAAKISDPLSMQKLNEKLEKEKEKKKLKKQMKKEREAEIKQKEKIVEAEENEKKLFLSLTDQEKRMLIVDRNFVNFMPTNSKDELDSITKAKYSPVQIKNICRCWYCGNDMSSSVPFEYFDYKFCTTKCLKAHRQQHQDLKNQKINQLK